MALKKSLTEGYPMFWLYSLHQAPQTLEKNASILTNDNGTLPEFSVLLFQQPIGNAEMEIYTAKEGDIINFVLNVNARKKAPVLMLYQENYVRIRRVDTPAAY